MFRLFLISSVVFFLSGLCWFIIILNNPELSRITRQTLQEAVEPLVQIIVDAQPWQLALGIFINNAVKSFLVIIFGVAFAIVPILFLFINGSVLGILGAFAMEEGKTILFLLGILPHGIIELPAVFFATALGLKLGRKAFQVIYMKKEAGLREEIHTSITIFAKYIVPLLAIAALIEAFLTPRIMSLESTVISWFT